MSRPSLPSQSSTGQHEIRTIEMVQAELRELSSVPDVSISNLPKTSIQYQMYTRLHRDIRNIYEKRDPIEYKRDITQFIASLPRPSSVMPGTLGAFIFGCLYDMNPNDNPFCSPACQGSIPPPSDEVEVIPCSAQVWYMRNGILIYHAGTGGDVKVYGRNSRLNQEEVAMLASNGARKITVYGDRGSVVQEMNVAAQPVQVVRSEPAPTSPIASQPALSPIQAIATGSQQGFERGSLSFVTDWRFLLIALLVVIAIVVVIYFITRSLRTAPGGTHVADPNDQRLHYNIPLNVLPI